MSIQIYFLYFLQNHVHLSDDLQFVSVGRPSVSVPSRIVQLRHFKTHLLRRIHCRRKPNQVSTFLKLFLRILTYFKCTDCSPNISKLIFYDESITYENQIRFQHFLNHIKCINRTRLQLLSQIRIETNNNPKCGLKQLNIFWCGWSWSIKQSLIIQVTIYTRQQAIAGAGSKKNLTLRWDFLGGNFQSKYFKRYLFD